MSNRPTPETDHLENSLGEAARMSHPILWANSRRLERERDELREVLRILAEHGEIEIQRLTKERDEAREENKKFREALEWIAKRYDDSKPTHAVAMDAYEMSCTAKASLRKEGAK